MKLRFDVAKIFRNVQNLGLHVINIMRHICFGIRKLAKPSLTPCFRGVTSLLCLVIWFYYLHYSRQLKMIWQAITYRFLPDRSPRAITFHNGSLMAMHLQITHFHPPDTTDKSVEGGIWCIIKSFKISQFWTLTLKIYPNQSNQGSM